MTDQLVLHVYRDLENRQKGEPDDGPLARQAHGKRRTALEADLADPAYQVVDWGATKDKQPHELVDIVVEIVQNPAVQSVAVPALAYIGGLFSDALKSTIVDAIKDLIGRLVKRMRRKEVEDFWISLPDSSQVHVSSNYQVSIFLSDGRRIHFEYDDPPSR